PTTTYLSFFPLTPHPPPRPPLFPYTTLFRSPTDTPPAHRSPPPAAPPAPPRSDESHHENPKAPAEPRRRQRSTPPDGCYPSVFGDRKSTRLNSSHVSISYAVFCLKKKNNTNK